MLKNFIVKQKKILLKNFIVKQKKILLKNFIVKQKKILLKNFILKNSIQNDVYKVGDLPNQVKNHCLKISIKIPKNIVKNFIVKQFLKKKHCYKISL